MKWDELPNKNIKNVKTKRVYALSVMEIVFAYSVHEEVRSEYYLDVAYVMEKDIYRRVK
jgi:hypothetical protein